MLAHLTLAVDALAQTEVAVELAAVIVTALNGHIHDFYKVRPLTYYDKDHRGSHRLDFLLEGVRSE